jgi:excisionase family DNA binding protein
MELSTSQVAKKLKIGRQTLLRWIREGKVSAPARTKIGGITVRIWQKQNVDEVRKYKTAHYGEGKGPRRVRTRSASR